MSGTKSTKNTKKDMKVMGRAEKEKVVTAAMDRDNSGVFNKVDVADDKNKKRTSLFEKLSDKEDETGDESYDEKKKEEMVGERKRVGGGESAMSTSKKKALKKRDKGTLKMSSKWNAREDQDKEVGVDVRGKKNSQRDKPVLAGQSF
ncbi:hypothetical protein AcW1_002417 [Taiwanofungus camphoratus]|nr:hypothetical protein AcW1_002417 [Antrodia cinnamomea]